jgi:hypothetical protein
LSDELDAVELVGARVSDKFVVAILADGREVLTPLSWYPILANASFKDRQSFEITPFGIHWPALDEDLSIGGMLRGNKPRYKPEMLNNSNMEHPNSVYDEVSFMDAALNNIALDFPDFKGAVGDE